MNILRIAYDWPDENVNLESTALGSYELSLAQAKLGHKIYILCANLNGKNLREKRYHYKLKNQQIEVFNLLRLPKFIQIFLAPSVFVLFYYFYLKFKKKIDLIHIHGYLGVWFLFYKFIFGLVDRTVVIGQYEKTAKGNELAILIQGKKISLFSKIFEYPINKFSDLLMSKVCKDVVAVSKGVSDEVSKFYKKDSSRIHILDSAIDTEKFKRDGKKYDFKFDKKSIILASGDRLSKRRNIDALVESMCFLPEEYKLVLWGIWQEGLKSKVDEIISKNGLGDRVKYIEKISYFKVDEIFRSIDMLILPFSYVGILKVVIEALASGVKVLAGGFNFRKRIPDAYLLDDIEPQYLARRILYVDKLSQSYNETREIIKAYYSWDAKAKDLEEIYRKST